MHTHQTASHFWSIRQAGFPRWTLSQVPEGFRRQSSRTAPGRVSGMGPWGLPSTFPGTAKIDRGGEERGGIQIRREVRDLLNGISLSLCLSLSLSVARWLCSLFVPGRLLIAPPTPLSTCSLSLSLSLSLSATTTTSPPRASNHIRRGALSIFGKSLTGIRQKFRETFLDGKNKTPLHLHCSSLVARLGTHTNP